MTAREAVFKTLSAFRRSNTLRELPFNDLSSNSDVSASERALATQILKGVLQNMAYCDYIVSQYSSIELKKLHPLALDILRISVYQIIFLTKVPAGAAVDEGVKLAKKHVNPRAAGFVNAILRKIASCAENGTLPEVKADSELSRLSILYSHPQWLVNEYYNLLGLDGTQALLEANNSSNLPVFAQVNTLRTSADAVLSALNATGVKANKHEWLDNCIELHSPGMIAELDVFKKGHVYIQDPASGLAVTAAAPKPGDTVIDGCAAPGGKSFASAIAMKNTGSVIACDLSDSGLKRISDGCKRLGIDIITTHNKNASLMYDDHIQKADLVMADVPCSGFGVIRKKPDIRYKDPQEIAGLFEVQLSILRNLSNYVKPGGTLLYSTCTLLRQENEEVIETFLAERSEFSAAAFTLDGLGSFPDGKLTLLPHIHGTDGFFICKLTRR